MAIATKLPASVPRPSDNASLTREAPVTEVSTSPVSKSMRPEQSTVKAVRVQTTIVSKNTSKIPHIPCAIGSFTLEAE